ncbi:MULTISPECIES: hypothetical protein [Actinosynnema]|uniref:hypothetical protein n=1 Tax=Actinosynnema TaxID=40566 RepID=UPI0020A534C7|nr:hypothetical protein [Actinosynnema pretiosum]MCP2097519.1 hypothetical protein [Actinosynnema pretiosum]
MRGLIRAALLLCATALAASACTGSSLDPSPSASPQAPNSPGKAQISQAIPEDLRPAAEAYARYREIDACGLHDPVAAEKASGEGSKGDELMPSDDGFDTCTLRLHKSEFNSTWTLYLRVAQEYDAAVRREAAPEQIGGLNVYVKEQGAPLPSCEVARPLDDTYAIVLDVNPADRDAPVRPICDMARDYVAQLAPLWRDPPRHGSGRTTPALPLAGRDPCQAVAAVAEDLAEGAEIEPREVFECSIRPGTGGAVNPKSKAATGEITVTFGIAEDPARDVSVSPDQYQAVELVGFRAVMGTRAGQCRTVAVWDPNTGIVEDNRDEDALLAVQVVRIDTPDCEPQSRRLVEKILTAVGKP